jgi:enoyl-CoA hydratase
MSNAIKVSRFNGDAVIRFTRPEIRNPLSTSVLDEIEKMLDVLMTDSTVEKVIFTGSENIFASGADLREIATVGSADTREFAERGQDLMNRIAAFPRQTAAAINGACYGGALDLALACNRRVATPNATFCHPGVGLGIITGWGGTQRLPRLVGDANAIGLFFTAAPIDAAEALRIGLVDSIEIKFRFDGEFR